MSKLLNDCVEIEQQEYGIESRRFLMKEVCGFYDELTIQEMTSLIAPSYSEWNQHAYQEYLDMYSL